MTETQMEGATLYDITTHNHKYRNDQKRIPDVYRNTSNNSTWSIQNAKSNRIPHGK